MFSIQFASWYADGDVDSLDEWNKRFQTEDEDENMEERETFTTLLPPDFSDWRLCQLPLFF